MPLDLAQWTDFFILVGTGSATLAGLVFVALTINLRGVAQDATHRYRAINMLTGFASIFLISALALMGHQSPFALGAEWLVVSALAAAINTYGYVQASGIYVSAISAIATFVYLISGSWLLILGTIQTSERNS